MSKVDWVSGPPDEAASREWLSRPRPRHFVEVGGDGDALLEGKAIRVRHVESGLELEVPWSRWLAFMRGERSAVEWVRDRLGR